MSSSVFQFAILSCQKIPENSSIVFINFEEKIPVKLSSQCTVYVNAADLFSLFFSFFSINVMGFFLLYMEHFFKHTHSVDTYMQIKMLKCTIHDDQNFNRDEKIKKSSTLT